MVWTWRYEDENGAELETPESDSFESRSDAESWLGEHFGDLADQSVASVILYEGDRKVYGPMSLFA